jgi:hypothetical protein
MAAPKTTTLKLKLRATGEEVEAEIKLLSATQFAMLFRKVGIKTASELLQLKDKKFDDLKMIDFLESLSAEALSVSERWTVSDVRNAFDLQELVKIVETLNQSLPHKGAGKTQAYG